MKKITKTFYVSDSVLEILKSPGQSSAVATDIYFYARKNLLPIEITFSVPEKTVTISEGDFDSIVLGPWRDFLIHNETHRVMVNSMKQKLFGESHD